MVLLLKFLLLKFFWIYAWFCLRGLPFSLLVNVFDSQLEILHFQVKSSAISMKNCALTFFISAIFAVFEVRFAKFNFWNLFFCKYFVLLGDDQIFSTTKMCKNDYLELLFFSSHVTTVLLTSFLLLKRQNYFIK